MTARNEAGRVKNICFVQMFFLSIKIALQLFAHFTNVFLAKIWQNIQKLLDVSGKL